MRKFAIGGALAVLLITGQAIAARLPEAATVRHADPVVAAKTDPAASPTVPVASTEARTPVDLEPVLSAPAYRTVLDRLVPVTAPDGDPLASTGVVGGLTEAETARLAARVRQDPSSLVSLDISGPDCGSDGTCMPRAAPPWVPVAVMVGVTAAGILVATDDDSESD